MDDWMKSFRQRDPRTRIEPTSFQDHVTPAPGPRMPEPSPLPAPSWKSSFREVDPQNRPFSEKAGDFLRGVRDDFTSQPFHKAIQDVGIRPAARGAMRTFGKQGEAAGRFIEHTGEIMRPGSELGHWLATTAGKAMQGGAALAQKTADATPAPTTKFGQYGEIGGATAQEFAPYFIAPSAAGAAATGGLRAGAQIAGRQRLGRWAAGEGAAAGLDVVQGGYRDPEETMAVTARDMLADDKIAEAAAGLPGLNRDRVDSFQRLASRASESPLGRALFEATVGTAIGGPLSGAMEFAGAGARGLRNMGEAGAVGVRTMGDLRVREAPSRPLALTRNPEAGAASPELVSGMARAGAGAAVGAAVDEENRLRGAAIGSGAAAAAPHAIRAARDLDRFGAVGDVGRLRDQPGPIEGGQLGGRFFSRFERAIEDGPARAPAEQWDGWLNPAKRGFPQFERQWSGMGKWLEENAGRTLTKEEVLQRARDEGLKIEEVHLSSKLPEEVERHEALGQELDARNHTNRVQLSDLTREYNSLVGEAHQLDVSYRSTPDHIRGLLRRSDDPSELGHLTPEQRERATTIRAELEDIAEEADHLNRELRDWEVRHHDLEQELPLKAQFEEHIQPKQRVARAQPRGRNLQADRTADQYERYMRERGIEVDQEALWETGAPDWSKNRLEVEMLPPEDQAAARSLLDEYVHWRKAAGEPPGGAMDQNYRELVIELGSNKVSLGNRGHIETMTGRGQLVHLRLTDRVHPNPQTGKNEKVLFVEEIQSDAFQGQSMPGVPFNQDEQWSELALRRAIAMAAEEGYDRLAWVSGDQAANLYNLRHHIDRIEWDPRTEHARAFKGRQEVTSFNDDGSTLDQFVGAALARRMREQAEELGINRELAERDLWDQRRREWEKAVDAEQKRLGIEEVRNEIRKAHGRLQDAIVERDNVFYRAENAPGYAGWEQLRASALHGDPEAQRLVRQVDEAEERVQQAARARDEADDRMLALQDEAERNTPWEGGKRPAGLGDRGGPNVVIEGEDLAIGGEGLVSHYDRTVSRVANKYSKQIGAKVEAVRMPGMRGPDEGPTNLSIEITPQLRNRVLNEGQRLGAADPLAAAAIARTGAGAAIGAGLDEENPGRGALAGGLLGLGATPATARRLRGMGEVGAVGDVSRLRTPEGMAESLPQSYLPRASSPGRGRHGLLPDDTGSLDLKAEIAHAQRVTKILRSAVPRAFEGTEATPGRGMFGDHIEPNEVLKYPKGTDPARVRQTAAILGIAETQDAQLIIRDVGPDDVPMGDRDLAGVTAEVEVSVRGGGRMTDEQVNDILKAAGRRGVSGGTYHPEEGVITFTNIKGYMDPDEVLDDRAFTEAIARAVEEASPRGDFDATSTTVNAEYLDGLPDYLRALGGSEEAVGDAVLGLRAISGELEEYTRAAGGNVEEFRRNLAERIESLEAYLHELRHPPPLGRTTGVSNVVAQPRVLENLGFDRIRHRKPDSVAEAVKDRFAQMVDRVREEPFVTKEMTEDWYAAGATLWRKILQLAAPELRDDTSYTLATIATSITSNGQKVPGETRAGKMIYEQFERTGRFSSLDVESPQYREARAWVEGQTGGKLTRGIDDVPTARGDSGERLTSAPRSTTHELSLARLDALVESLGREGAVDFLLNNKIPYASKDRPLRSPMTELFGDKVGRYAMDKLGLPGEGEATLDLWMARMYYVLTGKKQPTVKGKAGVELDDSVTPHIRRVMNKVLTDYARANDMPESSSQALGWYAIKLAFRDAGLKEDAKAYATLSSAAADAFHEPPAAANPIRQGLSGPDIERLEGEGNLLRGWADEGQQGLKATMARARELDPDIPPIAPTQGPFAGQAYARGVAPVAGGIIGYQAGDTPEQKAGLAGLGLTAGLGIDAATTLRGSRRLRGPKDAPRPVAEADAPPKLRGDAEEALEPPKAVEKVESQPTVDAGEAPRPVELDDGEVDLRDLTPEARAEVEKEIAGEPKRITGEDPDPQYQEMVDDWFNLEKYNLSPEGEETFRKEAAALIRANPGLRQKRVVTWEEQKAAAEAIGLDPSQLNGGPDRLEGPAYLAAASLLNSNAERGARLLKERAQALNPDDLRRIDGELSEVEQVNNALMDRVAKERTQRGRDLNSLKIMANLDLDPVTWLSRARTYAGGRMLTLPEELKIRKLVNAAREDPAKRSELIAEIASLKTSRPGEKVSTAWRGLLLSMPRTAIVNITGNTTHQALRETRKPVEAGFDYLISKAIGTDRSTLVGKQFLGAAARGAGKGIKDAARIAGLRQGAAALKQGEGLGGAVTAWSQAVRRGDFSDVLTRYDLNKVVNFDNAAVDTAVKFSFLIQSASDRPFRVAAYEGAKAELVEVWARREGLKPGTDAYRKRVRELDADPPDELALLAVESAIEAVFAHPTLAGRALSGIKAPFERAKTSDNPVLSAIGTGLDWFIPFTTVPSGVATEVGMHTPIGFVRSALSAVDLFKQVTKEGAKSNAALRAQRKLVSDLGKATVGTGALMTAGYVLAEHGLLTGRRPTSPSERAQWQDEGKMPFSMKVDGKWRSLPKALSPVGGILGMGAVFHEIIKDPDAGAAEKVVGAGTSIGQMAVETTALGGVGEAVDVMQNPRQAGRWFERTLATFFTPTLVAGIARAIDPQVRRPDGAWEQWKSRVPGLSGTVPESLDRFGRPISRGEGVLDRMGQILDPFYSREDRTENDYVLRELGRVEAYFPYRYRSGSLTDDDIRQIVEIEGPVLYETLQGIIQSEQYRVGIQQAAEQAVRTDPRHRGRDPQELADEVRQAALQRAVTRIRSQTTSHYRGLEALEGNIP